MPAPPLSIAIASCENLPEQGRHDDDALVHELATVGIAAHRFPWTDPDAPWSDHDAVLIRTTWDYMDDLPGFLAWLERTPATVPLFNPPHLVAPNTDKTYLKRLAPHTIPTQWLEPGTEPPAIRAAIARAAERFGLPLVVKPTVSAGAKGLLISGETEELAEHAALIALRCGLIIQPLLETLPERGELSIVLIDGQPTHAVRKVPAPGDFRCQGEFGGRYELEQPHDHARERALAAASLWSDHREDPLYARVDLIELPDRFREPGDPNPYAIIEAELIEPELFFPLAPHAAQRLACALRRRLTNAHRPAEPTPNTTQTP